MRWPLMWKRTHARVLGRMRDRFQLAQARTEAYHLACLKQVTREYQDKVNAEYYRARDEGRAQVHRWAVEVNHAVFMGQHPWEGTQRQRVTSALQDAEYQFSPAHTQLEAPGSIIKEISDGTPGH